MGRGRPSRTVDRYDFARQLIVWQKNVIVWQNFANVWQNFVNVWQILVNVWQNSANHRLQVFARQLNIYIFLPDICKILPDKSLFYFARKLKLLILKNQRSMSQTSLTNQPHTCVAKKSKK